MLAIDWSHTKGLTIYNGKKTSMIDRRALLKKLAGADGKSIYNLKTMGTVNPSAPLVILERECPLSLIYDILKVGCQVSTLLNFEVKSYREGKGIQKTDENDAIAIYELAQAKPNLLFPVSLDDAQIQLIDFYQRYKRYQKARVSLQNMKKAYIRQFGDGVKSNHHLKSIDTFNNPSPVNEGEGESIHNIQSNNAFNPPPSDGTLPYDIGIDTLKAAEKSCLKKLVKLAPPIPQALKIKGLGPRIWAGIYITANPANFPNLSRYLRYCGLVNIDQLNHKWNRHARMLYHMLADGVMKQRDDKFRPIYDQCKQDIAKAHPKYTKKHIHNAALNRTATFLAKEVFDKRRGK